MKFDPYMYVGVAIFRTFYFDILHLIKRFGN